MLNVISNDDYVIMVEARGGIERQSAFVSEKPINVEDQDAVYFETNLMSKGNRQPRHMGGFHLRVGISPKMNPTVGVDG